MQQENPLRALPSVNELLQDERLVAFEAEYGHDLAVDAARKAIDAARERIAAGGEPEDIAADALDILRGSAAPRLRRVLNATGVVVHTNLGRAPLAPEALVPPGLPPLPVETVAPVPRIPMLLPSPPLLALQASCARMNPAQKRPWRTERD